MSYNAALVQFCLNQGYIIKPNVGLFPLLDPLRTIPFAGSLHKVADLTDREMAAVQDSALLLNLTLCERMETTHGLLKVDKSPAAGVVTSHVIAIKFVWSRLPQWWFADTDGIWRASIIYDPFSGRAVDFNLIIRDVFFLCGRVQLYSPKEAPAKHVKGQKFFKSLL